ncbi:MAG: site-specific integrase [Bacillota bacterium]|nr:site-specific integrase [Bacillota bacterium]
MTVGEFLVQWIEATRMKLRPRTVERYAGIIENHVRPVLGVVPLQRITPLDLERAYAEWLRGGLSARTVAQHHRMLHRALQDAVTWGLISTNPVAKASPPRWDPPEMRALDRDEVMQLMAAVRGTRIEAIVVLALATGMRRGELLGLRWRDVDLEDGVLRVAQALQRLDNGLASTTPKTRESVRQVKIGPEAATVLRRQKLLIQKARLAWGPAWQGDKWDLVFPREDGQPLSPNWLSAAFRRAVEKAGFKPPLPRFHDLRHTFTTLQAAAGTPIHVISKMLGHSDVMTTLRIYAHVLPVQQSQAALAADQLLSDALAAANSMPARKEL